LTSDQIWQLSTLLTAIALRLKDSDTIPYPNPIGVPAPG
jgi:hypothetical protein